MTSSRPLLIVLGNQLFATRYLQEYTAAPVFMSEDMGLCTYEKHHQQKIVLFLAAMRAYAEELRNAGFEVCYNTLEPGSDLTYEERLLAAVKDLGCTELVHFEIEDKAMEARIVAFATAHKLARHEIRSPMFLCSRQRFEQFVQGASRLRMADFYKAERKRLGILVDDDGQPDGGQWSFDADNRKKLPKDVSPPPLAQNAPNDAVKEVIDLVRKHFATHPGDAREFWWPVTRAAAQEQLEQFMAERLSDFGPYEDAISQRSDTVFHSALSPCLNLGLLTPGEVISAVTDFAQQHDVPLQSVEGFVRQVMGWREFVRGVYQNFSAQQDTANFWSHRRHFTDDWYDGTTGIPPLDDAIGTAQRLGWTHHIPRLMVVANLMTLAEIQPQAAHRWFMEMYVDSSEWVMGPNVYGMGLFSDGGIFATKPYICGSNYLLKMSDYKKGPWCDIVDGLYWRFIDKHREFFASNPRLALMPRALDRLKDERRHKIFAAAEDFLASKTLEESPQ